MKKYISYSTVTRTLLALDEGARLLLWNNRYFLLSIPPARLTDKILAALYEEHWVNPPTDIGHNLAEITISQEGRAFAHYLRQQKSTSPTLPHLLLPPSRQSL